MSINPSPQVRIVVNVEQFMEAMSEFGRRIAKVRVHLRALNASPQVRLAIRESDRRDESADRRHMSRIRSKLRGTPSMRSVIHNGGRPRR